MSSPNAILDRSALEALYLRLERPLVSAVHRWLWSVEESQDVVQEAFVRLWEMRERVQMSTVEPLIWRISLNIARNRLRRRKRWAWIPWRGPDSSGPEAVSDTSNAPDLLVADVESRQVRAAIEALPDKLREVIVLCEYS